MDEITGKEFYGVLEGGAAAAGGYVWLKWVVGDQEQVVLIEQSHVGPLVSALSTVSSMAANERLKHGQMEPNSAVALKVVSVIPAKSDTEAGAAILDVSVDAQRDTPWRLYLSADRDALLDMRKAIDRALEMVATKQAAN